jgi:ankyrin repeat protein
MLTNQQMANDIRDLASMSLRNLEDLIDAGFNINEQDFEGNTYLHYCIKLCNVKLIETLCKAGANIYVENIYRKMPIDVAWECSWKTGILDAILSNSEMASSVLELRKRRCA